MPWGLFLGVVEAPERAWLGELLASPAIRSKYSALHEPAGGSYAVGSLACSLGWDPKLMELSDVTLFSCALGTAIAGRSLEELNVTLLGDPFPFDSDDPCAQAAHLFHEIVVQRNEAILARKDSDYTAAIVDELKAAASDHRASLTKRTKALAGELAGAKFAGEDVVDHLDRILTDPKALMIANVPTYKCLEISERILTADLRWVPCGELEVGDQIVAFDEETPDVAHGRRNSKIATITRSDRRTAPCVRVTLANGDSVVCTTNHPWLVDPYEYTASNRQYVTSEGTGGERPRPLVGMFALRAYDMWEPARSFDAGWLSGMYDGEGHLSMQPGKKSSFSLTVSRKSGPVLDECERILKEHGFVVSHSAGGGTNGDVHQLSITNVAETTRALGLFRPIRLLGQYRPPKGFRIIEKVQIVSVEPVGLREIQSITTDSGTYIGEGYAMHNSGFEQQFDTGGRIDWTEPDYKIFDPQQGVTDLLAQAADAECLVVSIQMAPIGKPAGPPVYARGSGAAGHHTYYVTNRPDELLDAVGGVKVTPKRTQAVRSEPRWPVLEPDDPLRRKADVRLAMLDPGEANYLKQRFAHRFLTDAAAGSAAVLVDGKIACAFGVDLSPVFRPHSPRAPKLAILQWSFAPPRDDDGRLTLLGAMLAMQRPTLQAMASPKTMMAVDLAEGITTVMFTSKHEVKGYRGLMELARRDVHPEHGFKLIYRGDLGDDGIADTYRRWWDRDERWKQQRAKNTRKTGTD